jgi:hypothetical protein
VGRLSDVPRLRRHLARRPRRVARRGHDRGLRHRVATVVERSEREER